MKRSEETKEKLRNRVYGPEFGAKISKANLGRKYPKEVVARRPKQVCDDAYREKQRQAHLGQKLTPEQKAKQTAAMDSLEYREKQRQSHLNPEFTPEWCANISKAKMRHSVSEEAREKISQSKLGQPSPKIGQHLTLEQIEHGRDAQNRPEVREAKRQGMLAYWQQRKEKENKL